MKKVNWPLTILFVWLFLFLVFAASNELGPRFCNRAMLEAISKQQAVLLFNCPEFWFNRYQSFAGNLITAAVAGITLWWVARQFGASNRQAAVAAAQALRIRIEEITRESDFFQECMQSAQTIRNSAEYHQALGVSVKEADQLYDLFDKQSSDLWRRTFATREYMETDPDGSIEPYLDTLEALERLVLPVRHIRSILSPGKRPELSQSGEYFWIEPSFTAVADAATKLETSIGSILKQLYVLRLETWAQIRRFEKTAVLDD